ncbi:hypothetical protein KC359_g25 [Hortaea werneckii]|nr:hypothetical protein KC359_g25 [Hortaea werneckii]
MREPKTAVGLASGTLIVGMPCLRRLYGHSQYLGTFNPLRSRTPNCHVGNAQLSLSFTPDMLRENLTTASPPDTGILSILPRSWVPYAELMRLDKPAGTYYLFLPCCRWHRGLVRSWCVHHERSRVHCQRFTDCSRSPKRVTNYPQFVLGLTFSWGAIMGFPALGIDLLSNTPAMVSAACLYGSCVAWTMVYDMIYAYQDIRDDVKAGIKSIALAQEHNAKVFLTSVSALQVGLLAGAGAAIGAGPVFYAGVCGGAAGTLGYMIKTVNLQSVEDCWRWFRKGAWFTGGAISLGLGAEYMIIRKFEVQRWDEGVAQDSVHVLSLPDSCERVVQHDTQLVYPHQRLPPKRGAAASISRKGRSRKFAHSTKR